MYHSIASLDSYHAPFEFIVPAQAEYNTDLSQSNLYLKFRILKEDGSNSDDDQRAYPINNFLHSMFSGIDLFLNNKLVTSSMNTYPYRAYIENLFSRGSDVKSNQLKAGEFWYPGAAAKFEDYDSKTAKARNADVAKSIPVELWGRFHLYLAMQDKYLPNEIGFVCYQMTLRMLSDDPWAVKIAEAALKVRNHVSFCSCVFQSFSTAITSLGVERDNLSAFRTFVRFVLVWICRFPLPRSVWERLRYVIVALPELFSYLFSTYSTSSCNQ